MLIAQELQETFRKDNTFLDREDIAVFTAASTDDALQIHRWEAVDLIILHLDMPGTDLAVLLHTIMNSVELQTVNTILVGDDSPNMRARCEQYPVDAIFALPTDMARLRQRVQHFLNVTPRASRRASVAIDFEGTYRDRPLLFRTQDISSRGMLIRSDTPLLAGDGISFSFILPDNTPVNGYGKIARDARHAPDFYSYGVKFTIIEPHIRAAIEALHV
ncbi:MAG TPA: PilZ domain-containing protein [Nitrospirota bacterium]|nr:PilZ domain-containing protein [Nitrospirota bacterium]